MFIFQTPLRADDMTSTLASLNAIFYLPIILSVYRPQHLQCAFHVYVNNLQIYSQKRFEDISRAIDNINKDLDRINSWMLRFKLSINPTIRQAEAVGSKNMQTQVDTTSLHGTIIPKRPLVKDWWTRTGHRLNARLHSSSDPCESKVTGHMQLPPAIKTSRMQTLNIYI